MCRIPPKARTLGSKTQMRSFRIQVIVTWAQDPNCWRRTPIRRRAKPPVKPSGCRGPGWASITTSGGLVESRAMLGGACSRDQPTLESPCSTSWMRQRRLKWIRQSSDSDNQLRVGIRGRSRLPDSGLGAFLSTSSDKFRQAERCEAYYGFQLWTAAPRKSRG